MAKKKMSSRKIQKLVNRLLIVMFIILFIVFLIINSEIITISYNAHTLFIYIFGFMIFDALILSLPLYNSLKKKVRDNSFLLISVRRISYYSSIFGYIFIITMFLIILEKSIFNPIIAWFIGIILVLSILPYVFIVSLLELKEKSKERGYYYNG